MNEYEADFFLQIWGHLQICTESTASNYEQIH